MEIGKTNFFPQPKYASSLNRAYKFNINSNLEGLKKYLQEKMGCEWQEKSSEFYGDYIAVRRKASETVFRIFPGDESGVFTFDMLNKKGNPDAFNQELKEFTHWLEEKGGGNFVETENYY
jgi:hypothetical protein